MKKRANKTTMILCSVLSFIVGLVGSAIAVIYFSIPDSIVIPATRIYKNTIISGSLDVEKIIDQDLSIHFLELGNKYTGDCTLIKIGEIEILIDAGSRADSVPVIQNYLNQYVDGPIEFVIVTHAHQDHIAGFGTSAKVESLFDLFDVETVIQFANHRTTANVYKNYCRELKELQERCGTKVYTALECIEGSVDGAQKIYDLSPEIKLEILDQEYYHTPASNENDNSVCFQIIQNDEKYYLFTGDLEEKGEASLVARNQERLHPVELYKAGHHGSKTSSSNILLEVVQPKIVCVCCCAGSSEYTSNNLNQFPTQDFINRIAPYTDQVFVTTLCVDYKTGEVTSMNGNIVVYYSREDEAVAVACANNGTVLKNTEWFKANRTLPNAWVEKTI